jgi:hypothetical protein
LSRHSNEFNPVLCYCLQVCPDILMNSSRSSVTVSRFVQSF